VIKPTLKSVNRS